MECFTKLEQFFPEQGLFLTKLEKLEPLWSINFDFMLKNVPSEGCSLHKLANVEIN